MKSAFQFDSAKLVAYEGDVRRVELDDVQKKLVDEITTLVATQIGMHTVPCRGLWLQAIKKWQTDHGKTAVAISTVSPWQRSEAAIEIKNNFVALAYEMLVDPQQRSQLVEAIDRAFRLYLTKYNRMKRPGQE